MKKVSHDKLERLQALEAAADELRGEIQELEDLIESWREDGPYQSFVRAEGFERELEPKKLAFEALRGEMETLKEELAGVVWEFDAEKQVWVGHG